MRKMVIEFKIIRLRILSII